ncbi:16S rRNA (guanine(527)-N(7))-methyltransferase RsmG [Neosynechococcus sphagnicola]|uniref:16S rRNA (guanine(527)-N(7))-methyltransferase RsmG n=1 Tax=Neosynechococcus sphagnicola TaxID=1501145 RepID=UPI000A41A8BC
MNPEPQRLPELPELWEITLGWQPTAHQQQQFQQIYEQILMGNQRLNLTRITDPLEFWEKHLWDSLQGVAPLLSQPSVQPGLRVIDIGTGAGFPGLPVAIARPDATITLLDSTQKKRGPFAAPSDHPATEKPSSPGGSIRTGRPIAAPSWGL